MEGSGVTQRKDRWRRAYLAQRSARLANRARTGSHDADRVRLAVSAEELARVASLNAGAVLAGYQPLPSEVDIDPLLYQWSRRIGEVLVPTADTLSRGRFSPPRWQVLGKQRTAAASALHAASLILVPGLAFGIDGRRLGRGAGWYDRALAESNESALILGVCFDEDVVAAGMIPVDGLDVPVDGIITPSRLIRF